MTQHRVDTAVPIEDVAGTVKDLIRQGKVKHFGLSEAVAKTIRRDHAVQPVSAVRASTRGGRGDRRRRCYRRSENSPSASFPFSPLGKGFLTGKMDEHTKLDPTDFRSTLPRFTPEAMKANHALVDLLTAGKRGSGS